MASLVTALRKLVEEQAPLSRTGVNCRTRSTTVQHAKAGADISVPMSAAIAWALKKARDNSPLGDAVIFPGSAKSGTATSSRLAG